jgi:NADH:ubiquinone oxidoreductase subunit E
VQDECGCIADAQLDVLEREFGFRRLELEEAQTFYTMFRRRKGAAHHVHCCDNVTCRMMGAEKTIARIEKQIATFKEAGFEPPFDLERVPCLGVCGEAPALLVDSDRYTRVTEDEVDAVLGKYSRPDK